MNAQTEIRLTNIKITDRQDIDLLIEAANDIQSATEANFKHMKEKKWFKRLWEMATFSKNNVKVLAKNTASLAQMQDIVMKAIIMASKESKEISKYLAAHSEQLEGMVKGQVKLADAIAKIKYGHDERPDINDMPTEYQYVIASAALKFADKACGENDVSQLAQQYLRNLRNCCVARLNPDVTEFDYGKINNLSADGQKLLAVILCEAAVLLEVHTEKNAAFNEVIRHVGIAPVALDEIKNRLAKSARVMGKEFIAAYYDRHDTDEDIFIVDVEEDGGAFAEPKTDRTDSFVGDDYAKHRDTAHVAISPSMECLFSMCVEEVIEKKGDETTIEGWIMQGSIKLFDFVNIASAANGGTSKVIDDVRNGVAKEYMVSDIVANGKFLESAQEDDSRDDIRIVLDDLNSDDVMPGDTLVRFKIL